MEDYDLDFETHLAHFKHFGDDVESMQREAQIRHACFLHYALLKLYNDLAFFADNLQSKNACYYMRHGAGRRIQMIRGSYDEITSIAPPCRVTPLSNDEQLTLCRDINLIYMQIRGVLDNFAWCFLYEKEPSLLDKLSPNDISLFSEKIRKVTDFPDFWNETGHHKDWHRDLKERRDPVAHRIPLYVPPSYLREGGRYTQLSQTHVERALEGDFERAGEAFEQMDAIGQFRPCFMHHPEFGRVPIYPTVPADIAHLVRLERTLRDHIS